MGAFVGAQGGLRAATRRSARTCCAGRSLAGVAGRRTRSKTTPSAREKDELRAKEDVPGDAVRDCAVRRAEMGAAVAAAVAAAAAGAVAAVAVGMLAPHDAALAATTSAPTASVFSNLSLVFSKDLLSTSRLEQLYAFIEELGVTGRLLYGLLYFALELLAVPALPLTLGSGYLFGIVQGVLIASLAATSAASASFLIARYGLRSWVQKQAAKYPKFRKLDRKLGQESFKVVLLLRLSPLLPFAISNYLYGLTSVNLAPYVLASWLGMLPGTIAYVCAGAAGRGLGDVEMSGNMRPLIALGAVATISVVAFVGRLASDALRETAGDEEDETLESLNGASAALKEAEEEVVSARTRSKNESSPSRYRASASGVSDEQR